MNRDIPFGQPSSGNEQLDAWLRALYLGVQDWLQLPFGATSTQYLQYDPSSTRRCKWSEPVGGGSGEGCCESIQAQIDVLAAQIALLGGGGIPDPDLVPRYTNPDGEGNRLSTITATSTVGLFPGPGDLAPRLVNGMVGYENYLAAVADASEHWIHFDFGEPVYIVEALWYQGATTGDNGTWQWQGSNNGTSWTNIGAPFVLDTVNNVPTPGGGKPDRLTMNTLAANVFMWRHYRMKGVSGSWPASQYVYDIEFKIDR